MEKRRHLDPRALAAIEHVQANQKFYVGPILIRDLPAALPNKGGRRGWRDAVAVYLLSEIIAVHRVAKGKPPYWSGSLYQVNRQQLAEAYACDPDVVSSALKWLVQLGLVERVERTRTDDVGNPLGKMVFVVPLMERIHRMLLYFEANRRAIPATELINSNPLKAGSTSSKDGSNPSLKRVSANLDAGLYPNCGITQQKQAAGTDDEPSERGSKSTGGYQRRRVVVGGGGGVGSEAAAAADQEAQTPRSSTAVSTSRVAPPAQWSPPKLPQQLNNDEQTLEAWRKACLLCEVWSEAIVRAGVLHLCKPTDSHRRVAYEFFVDHPEVGLFSATAVAISAWDVSGDSNAPKGGYDKLYFCRQANELPLFLKGFSTGKLQSEIGRSGHKMNQFKDLRSLFCLSELRYWGKKNEPAMDIDPALLWEYQADTAQYYHLRDRPLPQEVEAVVNNVQTDSARHSQSGTSAEAAELNEDDDDQDEGEDSEYQ